MNTDRERLNQHISRLHRELLGGSLIASAQIAELIFPAVCRSLRFRFSNVSDEHVITSSVGDAIIKYFNEPEKFDPTLGTLFNYIFTAARWKVLTGISSQEKADVEFVELEVAEAVSKDESLAIDDELIAFYEDRMTHRKLAAVLPDERDRNMLSAMMEGERDTKVFATILGISEENRETQEAEVKRNKDRIKKAVQRRYTRGRS